jgi:glycerol kinase
MSGYIMAIDEGTTSTRSIILNHEGEWIGSCSKELTQYYPKSGWVEHDAEEIWSATVECMRTAVDKAGISPSEIKAIGVTDQRETTVVWDKNTGKPICKAIVWQDRRTAEYCDELKKQGYEKIIKAKTGLPVDPVPSGTKLHWILENVEGARERAEKGELLFGTIECWLIWKMTGGKSHVSDVSNACRSILFNINTLEWDDQLIDILQIPKNMLPKVVPSSGLMGNCTTVFENTAIPITGACGDAQCSAFAECCFEPGMAKMIYGTAGTVDVTIGDKPIFFDNGLTTTIGWGYGGKVTYVAEGMVLCCGATIQWERDGLKLFDSSGDTEFFASKVPDSDGVYIVPAFTGLGAPYYEPYARGAIYGLSRGTTKKHLIRAALDSISYQTKDLLDTAADGMGREINTLKAVGGASRNNMMMQFTADLLGINIERPENIEATAAGAAYLAGFAIGYWKDLDEIKAIRKVDRVFVPSMDEEKRNAYLKGWKRAINATLEWANDR